MSDNIPFEIQVEIMKRLPVKSLIQFRSVSKQWKSLIDGSELITNYHVTRHTQLQHHLLVSYGDPENNHEPEYVSIVDDNTFPQHKFTHTVPMSVNLFYQPSICTSQGLVCFYETYASPDDSGTKRAIIWNPTIRKSVDIDVPNVLDYPYETVLGFGVNPDTCDPMLVKVTFNRYLSHTTVDVFTLSTKAWRRLSTSLPCISVVFKENQVSIGRFIYWQAFNMNNVDVGSQGYDLIMSFDMIAEEFNQLYLPDSLALDPESSLFISTVKESLVVVQIETNNEKPVISVWMMEHGDPKLFTKQYTINTYNEINEVHGFRKSGEPIIDMAEEDIALDDLFVYEPCSKHINSIGIISATQFWCNVSSYMETLLLLDF